MEGRDRLRTWGKMWEFCLHSLFREYGWQFLRRVAVPHPVRATRAVIGSRAVDFSGSMIAIPEEASGWSLDGARSIVGLGFCLKPMNPPCPSGRPNHDCRYLERLPHSGTPDVPVCCRQCAIREIGVKTLQAGAAFYIMTSAKEILLDVFTPALNDGRFSSGLFLLCRYSFRSFAVGMMASGIWGRLFPFERGDCRDYKTWLEADCGVKEDQTEIDERTHKTIRELLGNATKGRPPATRFERHGNVLYPRTAGINSRAQTGGAES